MPILVLVIAGFAVLAILRYQALIGRNGRLRHPFVAHANERRHPGGGAAPEADAKTYTQIEGSTQSSD